MLIPPLALYPKSLNLHTRSWAENERRLMQSAMPEKGMAWVHIPPEGIVVPRSYSGKLHFKQAVETLADEGLPVHLRLSGGGVVPQSSYTVNLHLAYHVTTNNPFPAAEAHYRALCRLLQTLFDEFGISTDTQAVNGSFCDGRFNLAANGRKIAGTAQYWQRDTQCSGRYIVLSHAVIVAADAAMLTHQANRFEQAIGSDIRYLPEKTVSIAELSGATSEEVVTVLKRLVV
ncbi:MAG: hypothetical protein Q4A84_09475 [Neisseria sp.]|uniref:lipoyl protein ligase domain-containing protein n=1 Tax=Neisseria sp. TaxID=192066 RepID=UPI0026DB31E8|nr:hypothetical protein [Neisseria sp.]MDO4641907.1 hypothetical protein [Neisseria sp.]